MPPRRSNRHVKTRSRSRSQSRAKSDTAVRVRSRSVPKSQQVIHQRSQTPRAIRIHAREIGPLLKMGDALIAHPKYNAMKKVVLAETDAKQVGYQLVDVKVDPEIDSLRRQMALLKAEMRATLGKRVYRCQLWQQIGFATAGGAGVLNATLQLLIPTIAPLGWGTLSAFFEEYKMHAGVYRFITRLIAVEPPTTNSFFVINIDYDDSVALTSVVNGMAAQGKHHLLITFDTVNGIQFGGNRLHGKPMEFHFRPAPGLLIGQPGAAGVAMIAGAGDWLSCTDTATHYGWLKTYHVDATVANQNCVVGALGFDIEFRLRE